MIRRKNIWLIAIIISFLFIIISYACNMYKIYATHDEMGTWEHLMPCFLQILWFWIFNMYMSKRKTTKCMKTKMAFITFLVVVGSNALIVLSTWYAFWDYSKVRFFANLGIYGMLLGVCCFWCISNRIIFWCPVSLYCGIYLFPYEDYYSGGWEMMILLCGQILFVIIEYIITLFINLHRMKGRKKIKGKKQTDKDKTRFIISMIVLLLGTILFLILDGYYIEIERSNAQFSVFKTLIILVVDFTIYNRYIQKRCQKESYKVENKNTLGKKMQVIGFCVLMIVGSIRILSGLVISCYVGGMLKIINIIFIAMIGVILCMCIKRNIFLWYPASLFCVIYISGEVYRIWEQWGENAYKMAEKLTVLVIVLEFSITLILNIRKWRRKKLN